LEKSSPVKILSNGERANLGFGATSVRPGNPGLTGGWKMR
jgi:hypothetical protein